MRLSAALSVLATALAATGCGGGSDGPLTIYSGREEELVAPLFELFTEETGIEVEVRYGDSAELAATIAEEGGECPADRRGGRHPPRRPVLGAGSGLARLGRVPARRAAAGDPRPGRHTLPRHGGPLGRHLGSLSRDRLQHGRALGGRGPRLGGRPH